MKKRIFALLLTLLFVFSFTACKGGKEDVKTNGHFGNVTSNSYTCESIGLEAQFEEDWIVYNENEILEVNGFSADDFVSEDDVKVGDSFTELIAYDNASQDAVIVYSEKIASDTVSDVNAIAENHKSEQEEYFSSCGYTDIKSEIITDEVFGEERTCLNITATLDGENVYISYIYVQSDDYLITFVLTSDSDAGVDNVLSKIVLK